MTGLELTVVSKLFKWLGKRWRDAAKSERVITVTKEITKTSEIGDKLANTLTRLSQDQKEMERYRALEKALPAAADRYYTKNSAVIKLLCGRIELSDFDVGVLGLYPSEHSEINPNESWSFNNVVEDVFGRLLSEVAHQDDTLDRLYRRATESPHNGK